MSIFKSDSIPPLFKPQTMLQTGFFPWEDFLSIIYEKILETVVDEVSKEMNGLQEFRKWKKNIEEKIGEKFRTMPTIFLGMFVNFCPSSSG